MKAHGGHEPLKLPHPRNGKGGDVRNLGVELHLPIATCQVEGSEDAGARVTNLAKTFLGAANAIAIGEAFQVYPTVIQDDAEAPVMGLLHTENGGIILGLGRGNEAHFEPILDHGPNELEFL